MRSGKKPFPIAGSVRKYLRQKCSDAKQGKRLGLLKEKQENNKDGKERESEEKGRESDGT